MNFKGPPILFTILLLIFLIIPYLSNLFFIEPFPAIILPSGHFQKKVAEQTIPNVEFECIAYNNSEAYNIPIKNLFRSVPAQYYLSIINNNLGFSKDHTNRLDEEDLELEKWYRQNIEIEVDSFKIIKRLNIRNIAEEELLSTEILEQSIYKLH